MQSDFWNSSDSSIFTLTSVSVLISEHAHEILIGELHCLTHKVTEMNIKFMDVTILTIEAELHYFSICYIYCVIAFKINSLCSLSLSCKAPYEKYCPLLFWKLLFWNDARDVCSLSAVIVTPSGHVLYKWEISALNPHHFDHLPPQLFAHMSHRLEECGIWWKARRHQNSTVKNRSFFLRRKRCCTVRCVGRA